MIEKRHVICKNGLCKLEKMTELQEIEPVSSGSSVLITTPRRIRRRRTAKRGRRARRKVIKRVGRRRRRLVRRCPFMDRGRIRRRLTRR